VRRPFAAQGACGYDELLQLQITLFFFGRRRILPDDLTHDVHEGHEADESQTQTEHHDRADVDPVSLLGVDILLPSPWSCSKERRKHTHIDTKLRRRRWVGVSDRIQQQQQENEEKEVTETNVMKGKGEGEEKPGAIHARRLEARVRAVASFLPSCLG